MKAASTQGLASTASAIVAPHPRATVSVGVVGYGYWGPNIVRNFSALENCRLHAVCDGDPGRLDTVRRRYPAARAVLDFNDLLNDPEIDAVSICTPVRHHYDLALAALRAGKHVLVEKPMTHSVATAKELVEVARSCERLLMVDHTYVFSGAVRLIKKLIDAGELGELLYFDSQRINLGLFQHDVNVVWDLAPHDLSIMDYIVGSEPTWVSAVGRAHLGSLENMAYLTVGFGESLIAHFHVNWLAPVKLRSTVIGGSKKMIVFDDLAPSDRVKVYDKGVTIHADREERDAIMVDYRVGDMFAPHVDKSEPLLGICGHFIDSIVAGTQPLTDGAAGLRVVRILEAAQRSIERDGTRIRL